tara:strand:+ start:61 stop:1470 length:1410 start_codon:yes stop_codon:yes gene_type:complete
MALNNYIRFTGVKNEQDLAQSLIDEHIKIHGVEFVYMPRTFVNTKTVMREVTSSKFTRSFPLEGYIENHEGFGDQYNLLTKFGVRSTAEMQITISQARFGELITPLLKDTGGVGLSNIPTRPLEGDLIYFPIGDILFEVKHVKHTAPTFYALGKNYCYVLECEMFELGDEKIETGIGAIDDDFATLGYNVTMVLSGVGVTATAMTSLVNGGIHKINIFNEGTGFTADPTILISKPNGTGRRATAVAITTDNSQGSRSLQEIRITDPGFGYTVAPSISITPVDGNGGRVSIGVGIATTGAVGIITVSNAGEGYILPPTITFTSAPSGGVTAIGTAILVDDKLSAIQVTNAGFGYTVPPVITVGVAGTIGIGTFTYGMDITGKRTGSTAYATNWNAVTNTLLAKDITGKFSPGELIVGTSRTTSESIAYRLNSIDYNDAEVDLDSYGDNVSIQTESDGILDFTEQNPFGEA